MSIAEDFVVIAPAGTANSGESDFAVRLGSSLGDSIIALQFGSAGIASGAVHQPLILQRRPMIFPPPAAQRASGTSLVGEFIGVGAPEVSDQQLPQVQRAQWRNNVIPRLRKLRDLRPDWDGYGAEPVRREALRDVVAFLDAHMGLRTSAPSIVPMSDGGIQLEWHEAGADVEIVFDGDGAPRLYFYDLETGREVEESAAEGFGRLGLVDRFC